MAEPDSDGGPKTTPKDRPLHSHGRGRELALVLLCHLDSSPADERAERLEMVLASDDSDGALGEVRRRVRDRDARRFGRQLVDLVLAQWDAIDTWVDATSARWRLQRMDPVDRNVLRLAAAELREANVERAVVAAEAVRLASTFGSERSGGFVNGVVEDLARAAERPA